MAKDKEKKGNYSGLFFGNITKDGELDLEEDGFFDKQLKDDLDTFTKKGSYLNIKSLGVDADDQKGGAGADEQLVSTGGSSRSSSAVDFEDIDELADDINSIENEINKRNADKLAKQAEENIAKLAQRLKANATTTTTLPPSLTPFRQPSLFQPPTTTTTTIAKKKIEDDFDFDEEEETSATSAPPKSSMMTTTTTTSTTTAAAVLKVGIVSPPAFGAVSPSATSSYKPIIVKKEESVHLEETSSIDRVKEIASDEDEAEEEDDDDHMQLDDTNKTTVTKTSTTTTSTTATTLDKQLQQQQQQKKKISPKKFKSTVPAVLEAVKSILERPEDFTTENVEFKTFCSGNTLDGGAIFKFSNLFAPKMPMNWRRRAKRHKATPAVQITEDLLEPDEQTAFNTTLSSQASGLPAGAIDGSEQGTIGPDGKLIALSSSAVSSPILKSVDDQRKDCMVLLLHNQKLQQQLQDDENLFEPLRDRPDEIYVDSFSAVPDELYQPLSQLDWEDQIIWEPKETEEDDDPLLRAKRQTQSNLPPTFLSASVQIDRELDEPSAGAVAAVGEPDQAAGVVGAKRKRWGELEDYTYYPLKLTTDQQKQQYQQQQKEQNKLDETQVEFKSTIKDQWSLFPLHNSELEAGDWINDIVWDESAPNYKPKISCLILDLNDRNMLFEEHIIRKTDAHEPDQVTSSKKGKSKKKQAAANALASADANAANLAAQQLLGINDKFNLSNDKFYKTLGKGRVRQQSGKMSIQHSLPAIKLSLVKTHLSIEDLTHMHRPVIAFQAGHQFRIALYNKDRPDDKPKQRGSNRADPMKHKLDLSAREGRVIFVEYMEQNPPLLSNVGMATRVRNYYRRKNSDDDQFLTFDDGETVMLDHNDESPFLGEINPGVPIQSMVNNLYKAPIAKHNPNPTDFLLIRSRDGKKWYIREMGTMYTAGQMMPEIEVPAPNSRSANMFVKSRLQAYIYRLFLKKSNIQRRLKISDVCTAFPGQSETSIRKRLKDCSDFQRGGDDSGWWTVKDNFPLPTEEELQKLVTPEVVCAYEAMLSGLQRIQDSGIIHFTNAGTIPTMLSNLDENEPLRKKCKPVEDELNQTPWNLSASFVSAMQGKGKLQLIGDDPRGEMFSFLKMPQKVVNQKQKAIKQALQKNQVTGTDADLRKLSLKESKIVLLQLGVTEEVINNLTRWQRIALVRKKSSEAALTNGTDGSMTKFARGSRYSLDHQQLQYKEQCQEIFENQMKAIGGDGEDEADLDQDLEDLQKDLEETLFADQQSSRKSGKVDMFGRRIEDEDEDEEEREEFNKLMDEMTSNPPSPSSKSTTTTTTTTTTTSTSDKNTQEPATPMSTTHDSSGDESEMSYMDANADVEFVKRVTLFPKPDGSIYRRIEIIRDPALIKEYKKRRDEKRKASGALDEEEMKRQRRKLQEKLRRLKRSESGPTTNMPGKPSTPGQSPMVDYSGHHQQPIIGFSGGNIPIRSSLSEQPSIVSSPSPVLLPKIKIPSNMVRSSMDSMHFEEPQSPVPSPSPSTLSQSGSIIVRIKKEDLPPISKKREREKSKNDLMDDYIDQPIRTSQRRTRVRKDGSGAEVELSNIFEKIIEKLRNMDEFVAFRIKVTPKIAPDYHLVIKNPIDLTTMRDRARHWEYKTKNQFLDAIKLMRSNCFEYNEKRNPHLLPIADKMLRETEISLQEYASQIETLERSISQSKFTESNPPTPISNPATPSSPPMHFSVDSPFFPPVSSSKHEDEEVDIVSLSGVSPSTH
ncbi:putative protein serine/threonine kinase [Heterostelium album PN500]|uniref:Bromo domain-containing protein n=1 Tax=Heterostelium pallidum (strain ATCC 26659 / Pp 5 / PN500) TaxID=670386 RepID=D3BKM1_HETP5|nr:putative protein serine/threonine kinase [Heterostelium album PN500]EFA78451.1 putative protein serine/threonine kinase [Heterostelium album PN500]|eukprot:XP_020430576.1 putative protein serine/threonine kinase [Heterostelium album PN500]